jgi:hypothetical protein
VRSSRHLTAAILAIALLAMALLATGCGDDDDDTTTPTSSTAVATTATPTSSTADVTTTSTAEVPTSSAAPGAPPVDAPAPTARSGGGSGEIAVRWHTVPGATGYRVQRAPGPAGPYEVSADVDVTSGRTTLGDGVTDLWSPADDEFEYVEVVGAGSVRYYRVVAYNDAGEGPVSQTVCGAPPGGTGCASDQDAARP